MELSIKDNRLGPRMIVKYLIQLGDTLTLVVDHSNTEAALMTEETLNGSVFHWLVETFFRTNSIPFIIDGKITGEEVGDMWKFTIKGKEISDIEYFIDSL